MKKIIYGILAVLVTVFIVSCPAPWNSADGPSRSIDLGINAQLPSDKSADTARSFSAPFTYQTLFPVRLDITVELYAQDSSESDDLRELAPDAAQVFLQLLNESGKEVFAGMVGADGNLSTTVYLPAANEDMSLRLQAEGFDTREVLIRDMVEYEEIVRTMAMGSSVAALGSKGMEPDADGDGIPDSYDTVYDPSDPSYAVNIPAEGRLTVAFEDLYGRSDAGDADYNDFIASYSITEYHENVQVEGAEEGVTEEMLTGIDIDVKAEEKIAGYDHIFGIRLNHFEGTADVSGSYIDVQGIERTLSMSGRSAPLNIELFASTSRAKGKSISFSLSFAEPQRLQAPDEDPDARLVDRPPYNPYLYVKNTGNDVHLVGEESLDGEYDPLMFMDGNNFPWALLVPDTWQPPTEAHRIEEFYPRFTRWRESGGELSRDWYLGGSGMEEPDVYVSGYYPNAAGTHYLAAYWKNGIETTLGDGTVDSYAHDVAVAGSDVYVVGNLDNSTNRRACYWENGGTVQELSLGSGGTPSVAYGVYVSETGDVYIAGYYENGGQKACYWKNYGDPVELTGVSDAVAYDVSGDGIEIFIGGQYNSAVAAHWKVGGGKIDLSGGSGDVVRSVAVSGTTVYAAGRYKDGSGNNKAAYWTDEDGDGSSVLTTLDGGSNDVANSIWITDTGDVYAAGSYNSGGNIASYWKNGGSVIDIESGLGLAATGIQVAGTDIYTSGYYNDVSRQVACYWKNDMHFDLAKDSDNNYSSFATGIFLIE